MVENSKSIDLKTYEAVKEELQNLKVGYFSLSLNMICCSIIFVYFLVCVSGAVEF
jgi:hypothetical protein